MPAALTFYGNPDDVDSLIGNTTVSTGQSAQYIPITGMEWEAGAVAFAAAARGNRVVVGSLTASGNSFQGSYLSPSFYVFVPTSREWTKVTFVTDEDLNPVGTDGFTRGDVCSFVNTAGRLWAFVSVDYSNWDIAAGGRYPAAIDVTVNPPGVGAGSMTIPELKAAALADAEESFPDAVNVHAETYAANQGMFSSDTLPNGWVVVSDYVSAVPTDYAGGVKLLDEDGVQQAYLRFPNMEMADGTLLFYAPKFIAADPTSDDPTDMRVLVSADVFIRGSTTQMPFSVQELTIDATTATIDYVTAPILAATQDQTVDASDYLAACQGQYDQAGTAWLATGAPTVGFGFQMDPMQAFIKTAGERRWTAEAPPAAGWEDRFGEFRLVADFELGVMDRASQLFSGQFEDPVSGGQVVVGFAGDVLPFTPDTPLTLRATDLTNGDFAADITPWASFGVTGTPTWDSGDGGRLKFTCNGTSTSAFWQTGAAGTTYPLPSDPVGQSCWAWANVKAAATPRRARAQIQFFTGAGVAISTVSGPWSFTTTTEYTQVAVAAEVPATAARYKMYVQVNRESGGNIPNLEVHYSDAAYLALAPVTHHTEADLDLSLLPLGTADLRWPAGAGVWQSVDDQRGAWLPIRCLENSGTTQPQQMPQYLIRLDLPSLLGLDPGPDPDPDPDPDAPYNEWVPVIGDSVAEGSNVVSILQRWTNLVQDGLGGVGVGYSESKNQSSSILDDPVLAGSFLVSGGQGLGYRAVVLSGGSATYPARRCTGIMVWPSTMNQSGVLAVTVDGTPYLVPTDSPVASYRDHWTYIPLGAESERTIVVTRSSAGTGLFPSPTLGGIQFLDGDATPPETYVAVDGTTGSYLSTPDSAALDITGDIDLQARFRMPDTTLAAEQALISKWDSLANQRSYMLTVDTNGKLKGYWSTAGTVTLSQAATSMTAIPADTWVWGRWTLTAATGVHNFYLSTTDTDDHTAVTWGSPVSTATTGATSIFAGTTTVRCGQFISGVGSFFPMVGDFRAVAIIGAGAVKAAPVWTATTQPVIRDPQGNLWTSRTETDLVVVRAPGAQILNCAQSGYTSANFAAGATGGSAAVSDLSDWAGDVQATRGMIALGINDFLTDVPPATFATNMQTIIDGLRVGVPDLPIVIVAMWTPDDTAAYPWSDYVDEMYDLASDNDGQIVDFTVDWPQPGTPAGDASGYYADLVHPTALGHQATAARILGEVFDVHPPQPPPVLPGEPLRIVAPQIDLPSGSRIDRFRYDLLAQ